MQAILRRRGDARLVAAVEGHDLLAGVGTARVGFALVADGVSATGRGGQAADAEGREQRAAREGH